MRIDQTIDIRGMDGFEDLMMLDPITQRYDYQAIIVKRLTTSSSCDESEGCRRAREMLTTPTDSIVTGTPKVTKKMLEISCSFNSPLKTPLQTAQQRLTSLQ